MAKSHSGDITVRREKWSSGLHSTARTSDGRFIASRKWKSKADTERVLNHARKGNITKTESRYSYLYNTTNEEGETRSVSVFTKRRIWVGSGKRRKLDQIPLKANAKSKYRKTGSGRTLRLEAPDLSLKAIYDFGVKL